MRQTILNDRTEKLLKMLPKEYHNRFTQIVKEEGLIDNCKYMLYFTTNYSFADYESIPCKTLTEAKYFIKNAIERNN